MGEYYLVEWTFNPSDYFEEELDLPCELGDIHIAPGRAELRIPAERYPTDHSLFVHLQRKLEARFLAVQVLAHRPYTLSKSNVSKIYPDGRRDAWAFPEAAKVSISCGSPDFILRDSAGNVVRDTKRERIDEKVHFAEMAARHVADPVANAILRSYSAAVNDPRNELLHLYEVREALSRYFSGEAVATSAVGVSGGQWSRIGQLANNEPLTQGRHRGKQLGSLRDATQTELSEAREIAQAMICGYLTYLEGRTP